VALVGAEKGLCGSGLGSCRIGHSPGCVGQHIGQPIVLMIDEVVAPPQPKLTSVSFVFFATYPV